jgi:transposase-like protein
MNIKVCPRCGGKNIEYKPSAFEASMAMSPTFKCNNCGYVSEVFPEEEKWEAGKKKVEKKKLSDVR